MYIYYTFIWYIYIYYPISIIYIYIWMTPPAKWSISAYSQWAWARTKSPLRKQSVIWSLSTWHETLVIAVKHRWVLPDKGSENKLAPNSMVYKVIFPYLSHLNQDSKFGSPVAVAGKPSKGGILVGGHHYIFTICKHQNNTWEMWGCLRYLDNPAEILEERKNCKTSKTLPSSITNSFSMFFSSFLSHTVDACSTFPPTATWVEGFLEHSGLNTPKTSQNMSFDPNSINNLGGTLTPFTTSECAKFRMFNQMSMIWKGVCKAREEHGYTKSIGLIVPNNPKIVIPCHTYLDLRISLVRKFCSKVLLIGF